MRRTAIIVLFAVAGIAASVAGGTSQKETLRIVDRDPLALRGEGFNRRERVRVTLSAPVAEQKLTRATARGTFRVTFLEVSTTRCDMVRAVAVGGQGSRAALKILPAPACMPLRQELRIVDRDPLAFRGEGFRPDERVHVKLSAPIADEMFTRVTAFGSFRVAFSEVTVTRCDMVRAVAVGGQGRQATVKYLPAPACAPMRSP
jgi:hypothetical protein